MAKKVTLDDIAAATNLSKYAVSRAISGKPGISDETRARVLECCSQLGYIKSKTKEDKYILLFIPKSDFEDATFWMSVLQGIEGAAGKRGYALHVKTIRTSQDITLASELEKASGVMYAGYKSIKALERYRYLTTPSLLMTYPTSDLLPVDSIYFADEEAGSALFQQLYDWGHRKFAFLGPVERPSSRNRFEGVKKAAARNNIELEYVWTDSAYEEIQALETELLRLQEEGRLPTAILCAHDNLAQSLIYVLNRMKLSVPGDISVTGFNSDLEETLPIPLTSVGHSKKEYGKVAFSILLERMNNPSLPTRRIVVVPQLLIRGTAGPPKSAGQN